MLVASNPAAGLPLPPLLATGHASARRFERSPLNPAVNRVRVVADVEAHGDELFPDLQDLEALAGLLFEFAHQRLQVGTQPPHDLEPPVATLEPLRHGASHRAAGQVEPTRPSGGTAFPQAPFACELHSIFVLIERPSRQRCFLAPALEFHLLVRKRSRARLHR